MITIKKIFSQLGPVIAILGIVIVSAAFTLAGHGELGVKTASGLTLIGLTMVPIGWRLTN